ncbi:hypothetical protein T492DRAFT_992959 [Pavlovales sp. CCMP2436]|nr:hypothetical protein T492DRAFT_992959 [Pavlovales sp. CCMP2436]
MATSWLETRVAELVAEWGDAGKTCKDVRLQLEGEAGCTYTAEQRKRIKALVVLSSERLEAARAADTNADAAESESESDEPAPAKFAKPKTQQKPGSARKKAAVKNPAATGALWEQATPKIVAKITAARKVMKKVGLGFAIKGVVQMDAAAVLERHYEILMGAGLNNIPSRQQLAEYSARRERERELDGMETTNVIVSTDRRQRNRVGDSDDEGTTFAPPSPFASPSPFARPPSRGMRRSRSPALNETADEDGAGGDGAGEDGAERQPRPAKENASRNHADEEVMAKRQRRVVVESEEEDAD